MKIHIYLSGYPSFRKLMFDDLGERKWVFENCSSERANIIVYIFFFL
jgi:hypothetical protein